MSNPLTPQQTRALGEVFAAATAVLHDGDSLFFEPVSVHIRPGSGAECLFCGAVMRGMHQADCQWMRLKRATDACFAAGLAIAAGDKT